jgi:uncharacterized protein
VAEVAELRRLWDQAWHILTQRHPGHAELLRRTVRTVVPLATPPAAGAVSAASRHAFGAVAVSFPDAAAPDAAATLVELLIHEGQHLKLGALLDLVDLFRPGGRAVHYAPWRSDPRPIGALLQGTYAQLGVTECWLRRRPGLTGVHRRLADFEFALWRALTAEGITGLRTSAELTDLGERFVQGMATTLTHWQAEDVPELPRRLAEDVALSYRVRWAIRQRRVPAATTELLVDAWRQGRACPPVGPPEAPSAAPGGPSESRLAGQARAWLVQGCDPGTPVPLLAGRYADAARTSAHAVRTTDDPDTWAELAVAVRHLDGPAATVLADRPDLVRAVCRAAADAAANSDPIGVAHWIATAETSLCSRTGGPYI